MHEEANLGQHFNNSSYIVPNKSYIDNNNYNNNSFSANQNDKEVKMMIKMNQNTMNDKNKNDKINNINNSRNNKEISRLINNNNKEKKDLVTYSIDDKYKNLENPFSTPEMEKKDEKEGNKAKIMNRINRGREKAKSRSVDNKYKKSDEIQKLANNLGKHLFKDENNENNNYD